MANKEMVSHINRKLVKEHNYYASEDLIESEIKCIGVGNCDKCELQKKIFVKLADYEDTGLTPDKVISMKDAIKVKMFSDETTANAIKLAESRLKQ